MFLANEIELVWIRQRDYFFQNILNPWLEKNITVNAIHLCLAYTNVHPEPTTFISCCKNYEIDKEKLKTAAQDGSVFAISMMGFLSQKSKWDWFGELLKLEKYRDFINVLESHVYVENIELVWIGRYLARKNAEFDRIFKSWAKPDIVKLEKRSIRAYSKQMSRCRKAVDAWTLVGLRLRVVKDIRNLIAKLIWESRNEEIYF